MGPRPNGRGWLAKAVAGMEEATVASMGPRPNGRGWNDHACHTTGHRRGFNGAAT